ncbi:calcineurin-like phosphoesterase [Trichoderma gamsii]|uniref:Calcineurin-like phosphoesterase n=1 Tax=Trichoderma gamsii TaxID=398673 RepID=A0A2P4ZXA6_9HYPO|nr:calcineurin-like phosphoesterase [Trichoderma gamsii]PON28925.1 calcineurin-like phosphoesterase [Trichoderma gamsii]
MFTFSGLMSAALMGRQIAAAAVPAHSAWPQLRFTPKGTFQMTVFNDLHFGEAENTDWGPLQDVDTLRVMKTVLEKESPQLVVINGDFITGENTFKKNSTDYVDDIVSPLVARGLPWASTYGNHDSAYNLSSANIYAREKTYKNSLTGNMVKDKNAGVSNYYLEVMSNDKRDSTPAMILWFFDSRGGNYYQEEKKDGSDVARPNWVDESVVEWFEATRVQLAKRYKKTLPSYAFVHIPVGAMYGFQQTDGVDGHKEPGINADNPLSQQGVQSPLYNATTSFEYTGQDKAFMKALLETEKLMGVFSGHDHGDDWCFKWNETLTFLDLTGNGLVFCFGRHTGYGGYGSWTRGSRQILVDIKDLGKSTKTWTRLEDGSTVGAVTLNSTYGSDVYPAVQLTYTSLDNEGVPSTTN